MRRSKEVERKTHRIHQSHEVGILCRVAANAKFCRERQVGTITPSLIPTLHRGADRAGDDGHIQSHGLSPLVENLIAEGLDLVVLEGIFAGNVFVVGRVLSDQGTFLEQRRDVAEAAEIGEFIDLTEESGLRDASQWVANPWADVSKVYFAGMREADLLGLEVAIQIDVGWISLLAIVGGVV